jgi:hypothetical protein
MCLTEENLEPYSGEKEISWDCMREKIFFNLYQAFGRGVYIVLIQFWVERLLG